MEKKVRLDVYVNKVVKSSVVIDDDAKKIAEKIKEYMTNGVYATVNDKESSWYPSSSITSITTSKL